MFLALWLQKLRFFDYIGLTYLMDIAIRNHIFYLFFKIEILKIFESKKHGC